ncbi:PREDICTED: sushi, von Willebrand factor type A, EGF and pentraxin domain-containing protein 1-like [Nicrophorus vespilloides]|uniref:Sushi, von Willebrand factor type A, EGF and pentraxin domain-containing protein 1-like n=1 Tax=Nicrophorus vespilloides TaxID=110193 RepID=A0ABM1MZI9_NICVS|nr:PREDICTED: sushi, von Willebrand factor type A, EGF and pentraxin domain-containing protein 1-like [Nicrophorus vespilloides]
MIQIPHLVVTMAASTKAAAFFFLLFLSIGIISVIGAGKTYPDVINEFSDYFNFGGKKIATKLNRDQRENSIFKSKVDIIGSVFKLNVDNLKTGGILDLVFLIDASSSVGETNFRSELKFVKKLLSDVTVDFNHTRIAVVTFSSQEHIVTNINEISMPTETNNKCLLLNKELNEIKYSGGGTYTLGAFEMAQDILNGSRSEAKKIIFLITDGFSNGGDPIPVAKDLKALGVTIFTIGILNGNYKELYQLASEPGEMFSFLLDSFEQFESLARRALHVDLQSGDYIPLGSNQPCDKLCPEKNCCDNQALCTCGTTTGHYACLCRPGYYGSGLQNGCSPCPSGSYASGPNLCLPCPDINHYTFPPAIGISSCTCKSGYKAADNHKCEVITCPKLKPPENGYFVKRKNCSNVLNSACGVRCFVGYTLIGSSIRLCLSNATWSGKNPSCEVKTCNKLQAPPHGSMYCKHSDLGEDFTAESKLPVDTVCSFACERGRTLTGSVQRTCLPLARWDGLKTACKQIKCNRLSQINFGTVEPKSCTTGKQSFGKKCNIVCNEGFELVGPSQKVCSGQHGTWDSIDEVFCKDITKPNITCPDNIQAETLTGKPYGFVSWNVPNATDNSNLNVSIWTKPSIKKVNNFKFKIGTTIVTYFAQDGFKNRAKCNFTVKILDKQPPNIEQCVDPPPFLTVEKQPQNLTWDEPVIYDNSQNVNVHKTHEFGLFDIGTTQVIYTATDFSNNTASCTLNITLQESKCEDLPDPIFGHSDCQPFSDQIQCVVTCDEGYALPLYQSSVIDVGNETKFICEHSQPMWYSNAGALLGCSVSEIPLEVNHTGVIEVDDRKELCQNESNLTDFGNEIGNKLENDCEGFECKVTTEAICLDDDDKDEEEEESSNIIKREIDVREKPGKRKFFRRKKVNVKFKLHAKNIGLAKKVPNFSQIKKDGLKVLVQKSKILCPKGSFIKKLKCVRCPEGTFHNETSNSCQSCTIGSYNDKTGQMGCLSCPDHYSTRKLHAKSLEDCIEQCPPGTYARKKQIKRPKNHPNAIIERTTLKPYCTSCPLGQYQSKHGQINCMTCSKSLTTFSRGAISSNDCVPNTDYQCQIEKVCNSGTCVVEEFQYSCLCDDNYIGSHCEIGSEPCSSNPCQNNGTCINEDQSTYSCKCLEGYLGLSCGEIADTCKLQCTNGGTCLNTEDEEICLCPKGFIGDLCDKKLEYCFEELCQNNGSCREDINGFKCMCEGGFVGRRCSYLPCDYQPCPDNAICYNENSTFKCECLEGFEGVNCTQKLDPCKNVNCHNGKCEEIENFSYKCKCFRGFSGKNCDNELKEDYILNFPRSSTTDFVNMDGFQNDLNQVSICLWVKTNDSFNYGTILSYATAEFDNAFTITDYTGLVIYINNKYIVSDIVLNDGNWNFFCFNWESLDGIFGIYLNGKMIQNGTNLSKGEQIKGGGKLFLGQEQDVLGGKFSRSESFLGRMAYFEMHSKVLSHGDIIESMSCNQSVFGDVYTWPEIAIGINGDITVEDSTFCKNCPILEAPINGNVTIVNSTAFYSCKNGYNTNITQRICTKSSKWDKVAPICIPVKCGHPGYISNGVFRGRRYTYSEELTYKCNHGYNLTGSKIRTCKEDGNWYPEAPKCVGIQCIKFDAPENAQLLVLTEDYTEAAFEDYDNFEVGLQVEVKCVEESELNGESVLTCLHDGSWDYDIPICKSTKKLKIPCSLEHVPEAPTNGYLEEASLALVQSNEAESVYYKCREGYKMHGSNISTCIIDGYWTELKMSCLANMCPKPPKYKHMVPKLLEPDQVFQIGNMLTYECVKGYKGFSNMRLRCMSNGNWGRMQGKCFKISCGKPVVLEDTQIVGRSYLYNNTITLICPNKVEKMLLCESDGKWKGNMENC